MLIILTILLVSFCVTSLLYIPFINLLYFWKFQRQKQKTQDAFNKPTPIFDRFHKAKAGTPVGGGLLVIMVTLILFPLLLLVLQKFFVQITSLYSLQAEICVILFTFISFGALGLVDDLKKTFSGFPGTFLGLRLRHKLLIEIVIALVISWWLYGVLKIQILHIPFFGVLNLGILFVPFATAVIIAFSNAFNITDGLDGLSCGVLVIALTAFLVISASILDTPLSVFIALWLGGLTAFLYFNVFPARIILGDVGSLSFGATLAVIGLVLGKTFTLTVVGGVFIAEVASSLIQLLYKRYLGRKFMAVAPLHLWLQLKGWSEPKIVARFWIISLILAVFGLWLSFFTK
jgi:phospho-N-acetylmuramoyl-pentapeptide-transferase